MQSMAHGRVGGELRLWRLTHHSVSKNVYARHVRDSVASAIRDEGASGQSASVEKCGTSGANPLSDELAGGMPFLIAERRQTALKERDMQLEQMITSRAHLGFIGLGYLGSRIARRLAAAGFPLTVWDRDPAKAAQFSAVGARVLSDAAELARGVDVVLSSLSDDAAVEDVYFGTGKVLENATRGTRIIELSNRT